jgi:hypothetical protein
VGIYITGQAIRTIVSHAINGYQDLHKKETGGHLLGYRKKTAFYVKIAEPYNTPFAKRTWWGPNRNSFLRKGRTLENNMGVSWIGVYHAHVEIVGNIGTRQSLQDKEMHLEPVQIIASITNGRISFPEDSLRIQIVNRGYKCCIRGWVKDSKGKSKVARVYSKAKVIPLGFQ